MLPDTVGAGENLELTWDGTFFGAVDKISLRVSRVGEEGSGQIAGPTMFCTALAESGSMTVPFLGVPVGSELVWAIGARAGPRTLDIEGIDHSHIVPSSVLWQTTAVVE
jgi:hypothetical protein